MLPEEKRQQLDQIVSDMLRNKESDANIKFVVDDFKKKYDTEEQVPTSEKGYEPGGIMGGIKRGIEGVKNTFKDVTNRNADIINSNQSTLSKVGQIAGQNVKFFGQGVADVAGGALSAATPDFIEKPVVQGVQKGMEKVLNTDTAQKAIQAYQQFKQTHPEAAGNIEAVGNFADFLALGLGAGKGAEVAGKGALKVGEKGISAVGKGAELTGSLAKTGTSLGTGLEKSTIEQILKTPGAFSKKEMSLIDRESIFNKAKNAIDKRLSDLSETGKEYQNIRKSAEKVAFKDNPVDKVLDKYGIKVDAKGKLILTEESAPLSGGDVSAIENFIKQYGNKNTYSANALLNARQGASKLADFGVDKTDIAGKIGREIRGEIDKVGKSQIKGLAELDAKYAPETKLLRDVKKVIFNKDGSIKDNAISKIANLTGKGKEQVLQKMEKIIPGIKEDVNILKAIEDVEITKGKKVGTYLRGATGGFLVSGGNPAAAVVTAIMTSPQVAVPLLRAYGKISNLGKDIVEKIIGKMKSGVKLSGEEKKIMDEAVDRASKKVAERAKNARPGLTIEDVSRKPLQEGGKIRAQADEIINNLVKDSGTGTVRIYHGTDTESANAIRKSGMFKSGENQPSFFTTSKKEALEYAKNKSKYRGKKPEVMEIEVPKWAVTKNNAGEIETHLDVPLYRDFGNIYRPKDADVVKAFSQSPLQEGGSRYLKDKSGKFAGSKASDKIKKISQEDLNEMGDFTDYVAGEYKPSKKEAYQLELAASRIAEKYGIKMPKTLRGLANNFGRVLEARGWKR